MYRFSKLTTCLMAFSAMILIACGGVGTNVVVHPYQGSYGGNGTYRSYDTNGNPLDSGNGIPLPVNGSISETGEVNLRLYFPDQQQGFHDNFRGNVSPNGAAGGDYLDAVVPGVQTGNLMTYTATMTVNGSKVEFVYISPRSWGSVRGVLTMTKL